MTQEGKLENWKKLREMFRNYFLEIRSIIVDTSTLEEINAELNEVEMRYYEENEFYRFYEGAKKEIEEHLFTNNNNSSRLINSINIVLTELEKFKKDIEDKLQEKFGEIAFLNSTIYSCDYLNFRDWYFSSTTENVIHDFHDTTPTEKIIFLVQLGIIEHLRKSQPFISSTNKLATALSGVTGLKVETIQSALNAINNPTTSQKNNPFKNPNSKSVLKVNTQLASIGFVLK